VATVRVADLCLVGGGELLIRFGRVPGQPGRPPQKRVPIAGLAPITRGLGAGERLGRGVSGRAGLPAARPTGPVLMMPAGHVALQRTIRRTTLVNLRP